MLAFCVIDLLKISDFMPRSLRLAMLSFFILSLLKTEDELDRLIFYLPWPKERFLLFDLLLALLTKEDYLSDWDPTSEPLTSTFFFLDRELRDIIVFCRELRERATLSSSSASAFLSLLELLLSDSCTNSSTDYSRSLDVNEFVTDFFESSLFELLFLLFRVSKGWILNLIFTAEGAEASFNMSFFL